MGKKPAHQIILVVDDTPENIDILDGILNAEYKIRAAINGKVALKIAQSENPPDLILLDIMMPEIDGYEVCKRLKANPKTADIPVIFITALYKTEDEMKGFELGAVDYITKPFNPPIVKTRVKTHMSLKIANERLKKAKLDAEAEAKAKSEFLANMSHEIRTPMNGVIAAADLALREDLSPNLKKLLDIIHSSGYSLLGIINDILDFSKIEAEKLELEKAVFDINEFLETITNIFVGKIEDKNLELLLDIDPHIPTAAIGDALRLQQIITNLVGNAIKFTGKGGTVTIGCMKVAPKASGKTRSPDNSKNDTLILKFYVKDTGIGMQPEYLKTLFVPFTQADASISRKYGGSGLGLTISKRLVEMMGGEICVESEFGEGTTFYFTVHLEAQKTIPEGRFLIPKNIQNLNVLIADDNPACRSIVKKIVEFFGYRAELAENGHKAVNLIEARTGKQQFDIIILDWLMPEMDGIETANRIRKRLKLSIPIIMMTAFESHIDKIRAKKAGVSVLLNKPVIAPSLFNAIVNLFGEEEIKILKNQKDKHFSADAFKETLAGNVVLIAEDNVVNQEIAKALLHIAGIRGEVVDNGKQAILAVQEKSYDAVLMDVQMPVMDGYEATRKIREDDKFASLPIIAMTANAMKGDDSKCLAAGMNDYISKPIRQEKLFHTLNKYLKHRGKSTLGQNQPLDKKPEIISEKIEEKELPAELPGIQMQQAMSTLNFDTLTYKKILEDFLENNLKTISRMKNAFENKNWELLRSLSHSLDGSGANIGAPYLKEVAKALETACRDASMTPPNVSMVDSVETALNQVLESIQKLV